MIILNRIKTIAFFTLLMSLTILLLSHYNAVLNYLLSVHDLESFIDYNFFSWGTYLVVGLGIYSQFDIYKLFQFPKKGKARMYSAIVLMTIILNMYLAYEIGKKWYDSQSLYFNVQEVYSFRMALNDMHFWIPFCLGFVENILWYELVKISICNYYNAFSWVTYVLLLSILFYFVKDGIWMGVLIYGAIALFMLLNIAIELGFRNKYPEDFLPHIQHVIDIFVQHGYETAGYQHAGTTHPEVILTSNKIVAKIRLHAPFGLWLIDVYVFDDVCHQWHFPTFTNTGVIRELLNDYFDSDYENEHEK